MEAESGETPLALQNRPQVPESYKECCDAFVLLSSRRAIGMGPCPISLTEIKAYIDLYDSPVFGVEIFVGMIIRMDAKYLSLQKTK